MGTFNGGDSETETETETVQGGRERRACTQGGEELRPHADNQGFGMVLPGVNTVTGIVSKIKKAGAGEWLWVSLTGPQAPFLCSYPGTCRARSLDFPFPSVTEADNHACPHPCGRCSLSFLFPGRVLGVTDGLVAIWGGRLLRGQGCVGRQTCSGSGVGVPWRETNQSIFSMSSRQSAQI